MTRAQRWLMPALALLLAAAFAAAQPQDPPRPRRRTRGPSRSSLLGLLGIKEVQKDLKLNEEQIAKVKKISEELSAARRKEYAGLREIEDRDKRRAKMTELAAKFDKDAGEKLAGLLAAEQMTRLAQIRLQTLPSLDALAGKDVADKLKLTDEQKAKLAQISKDMQAKRSELFASMRDASREKRTEAYQKYRKMRTEADAKALEVLSIEQQKAFEEMKGTKIEIQARPRRRPST